MFGKRKMKSVIKGPKTGFKNFSLKQKSSLEYEYSYSGVQKISKSIEKYEKNAKNIFKTYATK